MAKAEKVPMIRTRYMGSKKTPTILEPGSRTKKAMKDECDVNKIMKKYKTTGLITHVNQTKAQWGDFSDASDYQQALNSLINAQESFERLPAVVRKRFDNDPGKLLAFLDDESNNEEAIKLGLKESVKHKESPQVETESKPSESPSQTPKA